MGVLEAIRDLPLFLVAGLLLNLTPGADMALIAARSGAQGWRAGAAAALGVGAGCSVHTLAAALGLSAVLASSPWAFTALRWAGAAYLVWLGLGLLRSRSPQPFSLVAEARSVRRIFWQGFLTNALNPKVALFFLAFLPQFIVVDAAHKELALVLLGLLFSINGTLVNLGLVAFLVTLWRRVEAPGRVGLWMARSAGGLFVVLGLKLALTESPR